LTERIVRVLIDRNREYTRAEEQIGKLAALSKLAGNLAHELNNPASAARSSALILSQDYSQDYEFAKNDARYQFGPKLQNQSSLGRYIQELDALRLRVRSASHAQNSMSAGKHEDALSDWLRDKGLEEAWKVITSIIVGGHAAMWSILAVGFFNSIMFPTIFTLGVAELGPLTGSGSGILNMAIVGGTILPLIQGSRPNSERNTQG
jgi:hypothetical protein